MPQSTNTITICKSQVLMYDGNLADVSYELEVHTWYYPQTWDEPEDSGFEVNEVAVLEIDSYDDGNNLIEIKVTNELDPYVQSAIQMLDEHGEDTGLIYDELSEIEEDYDGDY